MNTKIISSAALLLLAFSFLSFKEKGRIESLPDTAKQFLIGALHNGIDNDYEHNTEPMLNVWHHYSGPRDFGWPGVSNDSVGTPTSQYSNAIRSRLDSNNSHNMFTLMDRPKFQYLAFGQRSDYQCEPLAANSDYWFYGYRTHDVGQTVADSGETVVHCTTDNGQGWIVKDLISNREQANYRWNEWMNDDHYEWFILPRIRINSSDTTTNKRICRIDVLDWDGRLVDSIVIKTRNLYDQSNPYSGQYKEDFYFQGNETKPEFGPGKVLNPLDSFFTEYEHCKIDFRVWYYGECEVWIDRIRVENLPAHRLLTLNDTLARQMIEEEVNQIALPELQTGNPSPLKFYVEEFEFNTVPCMAYISKMVDTLTDHKMSFMVNLNYELFNAHIPDYGAHWFTPANIKTYLIDRMDAKEIFMGAYCLEGFRINFLRREGSDLPFTSYNWNGSKSPATSLTYTSDARHSF